MLKLEGVVKQYSYGKRLFGTMDLTIDDGEILSVLGLEGSGKTTFLSLLAGLDIPTSGSITLGDKTTADMDRDTYRLEHVSVIYQNFNLFYHLTVLK